MGAAKADCMCRPLNYQVFVDGVSAKARERDKLERPCRYITRPAVSEKRLSLTVLSSTPH